MTIVAVAVGGALGAVARYLLAVRLYGLLGIVMSLMRGQNHRTVRPDKVSDHLQAAGGSVDNL